MTNETRYKKALVNILPSIKYEQGRTSTCIVLYEEHATDFWTLKQCRIQYVKDQLEFIEMVILMMRLKKLGTQYLKRRMYNGIIDNYYKQVEGPKIKIT